VTYHGDDYVICAFGRSRWYSAFLYKVLKGSTRRTDRSSMLTRVFEAVVWFKASTFRIDGKWELGPSLGTHHSPPLDPLINDSPQATVTISSLRFMHVHPQRFHKPVSCAPFQESWWLSQSAIRFARAATNHFIEVGSKGWATRTSTTMFSSWSCHVNIGCVEISTYLKLLPDPL
jgi:hypothetical protein